LKIDSADSVNKSLSEIWNEESKGTPIEIPFLYPVFFPDEYNPDNCEILFIGLNPSYSDTGWDTILTQYFKQVNNHPSAELIDLHKSIGTPHFKKNLDKYFTYQNSPNKISEITALDNTGVQKHPYFKKMHELAANIKQSIKWLHLDLFFYRKTNQDDLKKLIYNNSFFEEQKELSKEIIIWLNPKLIIIANAYACDIFRNIFAQQLSSFNDKIGTYYVTINGKDIPVFFSGMFSGQRALDKGTYERLKWHTRKVLME
jgi:hypothetical protein